MALILLIYLLHTIFSSGMVLFINLCIIALTATKVKTDFKKKGMAAYYLAASFLTVILFVAKDTLAVKPIFDFFTKAFVLPMTIAMIFILFFANVLKLGSVYGKELLEISKEKLAAKTKK
jgi:cytochrome bd-type quinol oxidase subunit 1